MAMGTPAELKALPEVTPAGSGRLAIATAHPPAGLAALKKQSFALDATLVESEIHILCPVDTSQELIREILLQAGCEAQEIRHIEPSLEDVFVTLTRRLASQ